MADAQRHLLSSEIEFVSTSTATAVRRAIERGRARRIRRGLVTSNTSDPIEVVVARNWSQITAGYFPGAVVVDRSALRGGRDPEDGAVFVDQGPGPTASRVIEMPGLRIVPRRGPGPIDGDVPHRSGLYFSSQHRAFLDNLRPSRTGTRVGRRTVTRSNLEDRLVKLLATRGEAALNDLRDRARSVAKELAAEQESEKLTEIIGTLLGTTDTPLRSENAQATREGQGFDRDRVDLFHRLADELLAVPPPASTRMAGDPQVFAFFESYFSNYIEGTEFTVDEAREIVFEHHESVVRPQDAHDIVATFQLVHEGTTSNVPAAAATPSTLEELFDLLLTRRRWLMEGRDDKFPGRWKSRNNRAGSTTFVTVDQVQGTLAKAFEIYQALPSGFPRAVMMMFAVSEVHPFADGNGRSARIACNAELSAAGECRLMIPTGYRENYLSALSALTHNQNPRPIVRMLAYAQRFTAAVPWTSIAAATHWLDAAGAFAEHSDTPMRIPDPWDLERPVDHGIRKAHGPPSLP